MSLRSDAGGDEPAPGETRSSLDDGEGTASSARGGRGDARLEDGSATMTPTATESVLIPSGAKMKSYACLRSLNRRGIHTIIATEYDRIPHSASRYCGETNRLPGPPDDVGVYADSLLAIASRPDVKTIIPVRESDVYVFAKYRDAFDAEVSLLSPEMSTLERAHDRLRLAEEATAAGVPVARTRRLSEVERWDSDVVVKSRYNILTDEYVPDHPRGRIEEVKSVRFLAAGEEPDVDALRANLKHEPIVQDFIPQADKHLYCALWQDGEPLATYQHRQLRQNSWVGGGGVYRVSAYSQAVEDAAYDLLSHLEWDGFACIEYIKDAETGEWKFLEINPRIWQSMPEAVRAGVDFPYYYWLATQGEIDRIDDSYETGIGCHIAYGEVAHLLSILHDDSPFLERPSFAGTAWEIAKSCVTNPRFDYIRLDDPLLFLAAMRETISSGVTSSRDYASGDAADTPADDADD